MRHVQLNDLELVSLWQEEDEMDASVNFPFTPSFPATTGVEADEQTVVYTELEPDGAVGTHTESVEELFVLLDGTAEVTVGDEDGSFAAGSLLVIPADTPHSVRNSGENTVRFVGVFPERDVRTEFDDPLMPLSGRVFRTVEE